jgi:O-antigen/teichoic acid export membrane protein
MSLPPIANNFLTVSSGLAFGQVLSLIVMPVLSRFYSAESFGVLGMFLSIASILSSLSTLQYGVALMLPKRDSEAAIIFMLGCLSVAVFTIIVSFFLTVFPGLSRTLMQVPGNTFLLLLPLYMFFNGANQMLVGWSVRRKRFRYNSISMVVRSMTVNSFQVAAAPLFPTGKILAIGTIIGEFGSCINLGYLFWKNEKRFFQRCFSIAWMKRLAKSYYDFPALSAPQNLLNAISQGLPVLLLGYYYGVGVAGLYAFGIRLVQAPLGLFLNPLRQVLFQKFCEVQNQGLHIPSVFRKSTLGLLAIIVLPTTAGFIFLPTLFMVIFGEDWREAGEFSRWLLVWQAFVFCNLPSVLMAKILRMQRQMLLFDIVTLGLRSTILVIGGIYWNERQTVAAFCLLGATLNLLLIAWMWQRIRHEELSTQQLSKGIKLA